MADERVFNIKWIKAGSFVKFNHEGQTLTVFNNLLKCSRQKVAVSWKTPRWVLSLLCSWFLDKLLNLACVAYQHFLLFFRKRGCMQRETTMGHKTLAFFPFRRLASKTLRKEESGESWAVHTHHLLAGSYILFGALYCCCWRNLCVWAHFNFIYFIIFICSHFCHIF